MNYCTQALEDVKFREYLVHKCRMEIAKGNKYSAYATDLNALLSLHRTVFDAKKFLIPSYDRLNVDLTPETLKFCKLPYPEMALECYDERHMKRKKRIILLVDSNADTHIGRHMRDAANNPGDYYDGFFLTALFYDEELKGWGEALSIMHISPDDIHLDDVLSPDSTFSLPVVVEPTFPGTYAEYKKQLNLTSEQARLNMYSDLEEDMKIALRALVMLNAKNLNTITVVEPSKALNKKRSKTAKPPFFEYKTLDVFVTTEGAPQIERKKINYAAVQNMMKGGSNLRLHGVRGHFKVRKSGVYWWNSFVRGSSKHGVIEKEYNIREKE